MKLKILFLALIIISVITSNSWAGMVYFFGDSITYGTCQVDSYYITNDKCFRYLLSNYIKKNLEEDAWTINGGVPGDSTENANKRFKDLLNKKPEMVFIMFGTNDVWPKNRNSAYFPKVDVEVYKDNIERWIKSLKEINAHVILMTPPPFTGNANKFFNTEKNINNLLKKYVFACQELAIRNHIDLVDNYRKFTNISGNMNQYYLDDGVHPNTAGHEIIFNNIVETVFLNKNSYFNNKSLNSSQNNYNNDDLTIPVGLINVAYMKNYIENSADSNCKQNSITDGITQSINANKDIYFTSNIQKFPKWVVLDLEKMHECHFIKFYNSSLKNMKKVKIYFSNDLKKFSQIGTHIFTPDEETYLLKIDPIVDARYFKIEFIDSYDNNKISLNEIEIYGM